MSKVKNENYITIQGWMVNELGLKGNELLVYATIYGFSQTDNQVFTGSLQYLADWTNSSRQGIQKNLKTLVDKGYIVKTDKYINGVKFCEYCTTKFNEVYNSVVQGMQQSCTDGVQQSCTNNISLNNNDIDINKESKKERKSNYDVIINQFVNDNEIKDYLYEFIKMRKLMKKPMTDRALKQLIQRLLTLSTNKQEQLKILENSIINNWANVYPLIKDKYRGKKEIVPDWLNKDIKKEPMNEEELKEIQEEYKQFNPDLQERAKKLQERIKRDHAKQNVSNRN